MKYKTRRILVSSLAIISVLIWIFANPESYEQVLTKAEEFAPETNLDNSAEESNSGEESNPSTALLATEALGRLEVKGRAPKTGYSRDAFYPGWPTVDGCSLRQRIIKREFGDSAVMNGCDVISGEFDEPYTGKHMTFTSRDQISKGIQIDHVVALSDAWQKGAQYLDYDTRNKIATDPLNLLAVDAAANEKKSDGDAATWLPSNKKFRCQYVARQVSVKYKYKLWVTEAEKAAIARILEQCPSEPTIGI